jgi:hypothetical protein
MYWLQVQQQMQQQADQLAGRYGKALGLCAADILWALGQVQARKVVVDDKVRCRCCCCCCVMIWI